MSFIAELKRRGVVRVGTAYAVTAWLVVQIAETVFPLFGLGDDLARLVVILLGVGFLPALILAWVFEATPTGVQTDGNARRQIASSAGGRSSRWLDRAIVVVAVLAVAYFAVDKFVFDPIRDQEMVSDAAELAVQEALLNDEQLPSIAVLPFVDMSESQDQEYFSDGIAETLLHILAEANELSVAARTSSFAFKGKNLPIAQIGEELNVAYVLEGSTMRSGDSIRVTAQLIETKTGYHLWSHQFDRPFGEIFAVQDEISREVAERLHATILPDEENRSPNNPEVYATYLRALHSHRQFGAEALSKALELYREVLEAEPNYPGVWTNVSSVYSNLAAMEVMPEDEAYREARVAAENALLANSQDASAFDQLGWIALRHENDYPRAIQFYEKALALDPKRLSILGNAAVLLMETTQLDKAIEILEYQTRSDPTSAIAYNNLANAYHLSGRFADAEKSARVALELSPSLWGGRYRLGRALLLQGRFEEALTQFDAESTDEEYRLKGRALAYHALGRLDEAASTIEELVEKFADEYPDDVAQVYAYADNNDAAFALLESMSEPSNGRYSLKMDPLLQNLHGDARWRPLLEKHKATDSDYAALAFDAQVWSAVAL